MSREMPKFPHLAFPNILSAHTGEFGIRLYKFTILSSNTAGASPRPTGLYTTVLKILAFHPIHG